MDPNAAYKMMTEHLKAGDYSEACDAAAGLITWIEKGGFLPDVPNATTRAPSALRCQVIAKCWKVINRCAEHIDL